MTTRKKETGKKSQSLLGGGSIQQETKPSEVYTRGFQPGVTLSQDTFGQSGDIWGGHNWEGRRLLASSKCC